MGSNWKEVTLSDLGEVARGRSRHRPRYAEHLYGGEYPFIQTGDIKASGGRISAHTQTYSEAGLAQSRIWPAKTMCITIAANIAETGILKYPACFPDSVIGFIANEEKANVYFIEYLFRQLRKELQRQATGSVQDNINLQTLERLKFKVPTVEEQKKIASFLNYIEDKITLNRQINQTLEQMAQALFKSWFVDFDPVVDNALDAGFFAQELDLPDELLRRAEARQAVRQRPDFKPLPDATRQLFPAAFEACAELLLGLGGWVPKGWKYENFEYLLSMTIGGDWGKDLPDESHSVQSRIVRGTDIPDLMNGQLSKAPLRWVEPKKLKSRQIEVGDIIIEVSGGSPTQSTGRSIFMSDLMLQRLGGVVEPASFCRRFKPKSINFGLLGFLHLQKIYADGKMWEYQNQSTGIANFQTKFFLEAEPILLPSSDVLGEFCKQVKPLIDKSQSNEQIILANLRDTLLPKLISGELRLDNIKADLATE
jgi:type I restriction enzyme, S subunit